MNASMLVLSLLLSHVVSVVGDEGAPLQGATLSVVTAEGIRVEDVTDEAGSARLEVEAGPGAAACVGAPGRASARLSLSAAGSDVVRLSVGAGLRGRVLVAGGGPLKGAKLSVKDAVLGDCAPMAVTDEEGWYRLEGLRPVGSVRVAVTGPGVLAVEDVSVRVEAGKILRRDFALHPSVALVANASTATGPLPGASVRVIPEWEKQGFDPPLPKGWKEDLEEWRDTTDAKGVAPLPDLPRRLAWRVAFSAEGFAPQSVRADGRAPTGVARALLTPGGGVTLRAVDEEGVPRPAPAAHLRSDDVVDADLVNDPPPGGADGILRIRHLPPGAWTIRLVVPGGIPRVMASVVVAEGKMTELGDVLVPPGASLEGVVVDDLGSPVAGAAVTAAAPVDGRTVTLEATSPADGRFRFDGLDPAARVELTAKAQGHQGAELELVTPGLGGVELVLARAGSIVGFVREAASDEPLAGATVRVEPAGEESGGATGAASGAGPPARPVFATSGEDGAWSAEGLSPGAWRVRASAPGFLPSAGEPLTLRLGGESPSVTLRLGPGASLAGRCVEGEARRAVPGATVTATLSSGATSSARADEDGGFVLGGLAGIVDVVARHPLFEDAKLLALDVETRQEPIELALQPGGSVEGTVRGKDGEILVGASVAAIELVGRQALSGADGTYRIDGLPEGRWKLTKVDRASTYEGREEAVVEVRRGQVTRRDFGGGTRLVGTVSANGRPVGGVLLGLMESPDMPADPSSLDMGKIRGFAVRTRDDGRYEASGLDPGRWCVTLTWQGRKLGVDVDIPAGAREVTRDIDIPDLRVAGLVVNDDTGGPIAGAHVSAHQPGAGDSRMSMNSFMREGGEPDGLAMGTTPEVSDTTGPDGRFELLLPAEGKWSVGAFVWRPERLAPVGENRIELDVTASRDDLVFHFARRKAGILTVSAIDAATREPLHDGVAYAWTTTGDPIGQSCPRTARFTELEPGEEYHVIAFMKGHAPAWRSGVTVADGEPAHAELALPRGGDVRLLVPSGALSINSWRHVSGNLRIQSSDGVDLTRFRSINGTAIAWGAEQSSPTEWIFHDMPEGRLTISLGEGAALRSAVVDVSAAPGSEPAVADLR